MVKSQSRKCPYCGQELKDKRSDEALGMFWRVRDKIADLQGEDRDITRYDLQYAFGLRVTYEEFELGRIPDFEGKWVLYKGQYVFFKTLNKYTRDEMDVLTQSSKGILYDLGGEL